MTVASPKALIIEDDDEMRSLCVRGLQAWGYSVFQCSDGQRGWDTLNDNTDIALLILDVCLPGLDGLEVLERIRLHSSFKELPVVVISGYVPVAKLGPQLNPENTRFLAKPFTYAKFRQNIEVLTDCFIRRD